MRHLLRRLLPLAVVAAVLASLAAPVQAAYRFEVPGNQRSSAQTSSSVTLDWDDVPGARAYRVQLSTDPTMKGATYHRFTTSRGTVTRLEADTIHYFRVAVIDPVTGEKLSDYKATPYPSASTLRAGSTSVSGWKVAVPTGLRTTSTTATSLSLAWDHIAGAKSYRVQLSTSSSMSGATYHRFTEASGTIGGLRANTTYHYRVAVIDPDSGDKLGDYTQKPYPSTRTAASGASYPGGYAYPVPASLRATASTASTLTLDWADVAGAPMYRVQYSTSSSMKGAKYAPFSASQGTITGLAKNTTYHVRVAVVEAGNGGKLSDYTQTPYPTAKTLAGVSYPGGYGYPVPGELRSTGRTTSSVTLDWNDVPGAPMYRVQYSTSSSMKGAKYAGFSGSQGTLTGLARDTIYHVRVAVVEAGNGGKLSDYTQTPYPTVRTAASASPTPTPTPTPSATPRPGHPGGYAYPVPATLRVTSSTPRSLTLDWADVAGAPMYRVQYSTSSSMKGAKYAGFDESAGTLTGLDPQRTYWIRVAVVEAGNGGKLSDYTQTPYLEARTPALYPGGYEYPIPSALVSPAQTHATIDLDWADVPGAPMYRVQYSTDPTMKGAKYASFTRSEGQLTGLAPVTTYHVRVAVVEAGDGAKLSDYTGVPYTQVATVVGGPVDVRVGSFNVHGVNNDVTVGPDRRPWKERRVPTIAQITAQDLDVVGLQEANQSGIYNNRDGKDWTPQGDNQFLDLKAGLRAGGKDWRLTNEKWYNCARHTSSNNCSFVDQGASMATRILYRGDRLEMLSSGSIRYESQFIETERYMAWAIFKIRETGKEFFFTTTHLSPSDATIRGLQWQQLLVETTRLAGDRPVVAAGDFNSSKFNLPAGDMLVAMKNAGFGDVINQQYRVNPSVDQRAEEIVNGFYNSYNGFQRDLYDNGSGKSKCYCTQPWKTGNGIDYIFASNDLPVKRYEVVMDVDANHQLLGVIPSDHHLLAALLRI